MNIHVTDTIDSLVSRNLKAARILSKYGIDYCEGGKSIKEACEEANVSFRKLLGKIRQADMRKKEMVSDVSSWEPDAVTRYVEQYHHRYINDNIGFIKTNISRLVRIFGRKHAELKAINLLFEEMTAHITVHMQYEEMIVFPYIRALVKNRKSARSAIFRSLESPIRSMITEHQNGNAYMRKLDELTHHYIAPPECGSAYQITYDALRDFEKDLHRHLEIENDILFPKALEIEERLDHKTWLPKRQA